MGGTLQSWNYIKCSLIKCVVKLPKKRTLDHFPLFTYIYTYIYIHIYYQFIPIFYWTYNCILHIAREEERKSSYNLLNFKCKLDKYLLTAYNRYIYIYICIYVYMYIPSTNESIGYTVGTKYIYWWIQLRHPPIMIVQHHLIHFPRVNIRCRWRWRWMMEEQTSTHRP
jgi:hypothetical protein